ncbi:MAG TPA: type IV secretory system conjugative DNA transfer family protein [Acidimicrobiales bacterium]|nr:type IV secretory system conjugative DNA transfer family protein [Acidimicrobiales bacterium]
MLTGGQGPSADDPAERAAAIVLIVLAGAVLLILATGHVSALLFSGGWPHYPLDEVPGVLGRAITHPLDPAEGWDPVNTGADVPGPVAWWFTLVLLLAIVLVPLFLLVRRADSRDGGGGVASVSPVRQREVRKLALTREDEGELVVGTMGGHEIAVKDRRSLLVLGPIRSGKTTAVTIPALLEWPGPVVVTSTGGDVVDHTIGWRSRMGDVHVFDPLSTTRHRASGWSPLATCSTWLGAQHTAWDLAMAGKASIGTTSGVGEFWFSSAARSLAPYLFAAAESAHSMGDVARWIDSEERDEVLNLLRPLEPDAAVAHAATFRREDAARASLFHVMQQILGAYLDPTVAASALRHEVEPAELLDGDPHTLYIVAPHHEQARVRPLYAALVRQVLTAVHERVEHGRRPLDAPLLLVLDDAADIAPIEDLPTLAATSAVAGMQMVTVFRDLTQIEVRHGEDAPKVLANHRAKLLLPGTAGVDAVAFAGRLGSDAAAGEGEGGVRPADPLAALPPELARHLPADEALLLYEQKAPVRVRLRPWYKSRELRRRAGAAQDALLPSEGVDMETLSPFIGDPVGPSGPIINPVPDPPAFDPTFSDGGAAPHFPSNVSPLDAARARLRRRRAPSHDEV